jgi:hypothetical protein
MFFNAHTYDTENKSLNNVNKVIDNIINTHFAITPNAKRTVPMFRLWVSPRSTLHIYYTVYINWGLETGKPAPESRRSYMWAQYLAIHNVVTFQIYSTYVL